MMRDFSKLVALQCQQCTVMWLHVLVLLHCESSVERPCLFQVESIFALLIELATCIDIHTNVMFIDSNMVYLLYRTNFGTGH